MMANPHLGQRMTVATHRILVGDVLDKLAELPEKSVHCIWTDPPYNLGVNYGCDPKDDDLDPTEYLFWVRSWIILCAHRLVLGGAFWLLINEKWADHVGIMLTDYVGPRVNRIIWRERFGQYRETRFPQGHRHLFLHARGCDQRILRVWNTDSIREPSVRMQMGDARAAGPRVPDDVWDVSRLQGNDKERVQGHPCQLRQWPIERCILATTNEGDIVLDPFLGSGTTMVAAVKHNRSCIGIELNPEYAAMAEARLADYAPLFTEASA